MKGLLRSYFKNKTFNVVEGFYSLEEMITYFNKQELSHQEIHIVSHRNPWAGISLKTSKEGVGVSVNSISQTALPKLKNNSTCEKIIVFHSGGLGESKALLFKLKEVFRARTSTKIGASKYFNVFGGKYADHYLAKPYYVFYPTAYSPGPMSLSQEIKTQCPMNQIDWFTALKAREETALDQVFSHRFNIPIEYEFQFSKKQDIPTLKDKDAVMDFVSEEEQLAMVLYDLGIPIEKYRWSTKTKGNELKIEGKLQHSRS
ncbi:MAG: hypothetical protein ACJA1Z_002103 [Patiriisocius sp.]